MKNLIKKINLQKLIIAIDQIIEHYLFKPVVISIITSFVLFHGFEIVQDALSDYKESAIQKEKTTPIKINISGKGIDFEIAEEQLLEHKVKSGDTFLKILIDTNAPEDDIFAIIADSKKVFNPRSIVVGDKINIKYNIRIGYADTKQDVAKDVIRKVTISSIEISRSVEEKIVISREGNAKYSAKKVKIKLVKHISKYKGVIKNGLFVDAIASGMSPTSVMNMINLYSYDIDFQRDIRSGNKFELVVEGFYSEDGKRVKDGNILFSAIILKHRSIEIYMHKIRDNVEYFDSDGNSTRKSLLRTPINGARVSSRFGMRRHPVLGYSKMHKGTDFAARRGTPILAAGSGKIIHYSRKGGYGNFVLIRHNSRYSTAYGHASRFNKRFRVGSRVKQGDVIAYVGTTGRSTGPHLHFEVRYKGKQINPSKVKATSGKKLKGKELARFKKSKAKIEEYRANIPTQASH